MGIIKVLKRKDGASLVVGVALGFMVYIFATTVVGQLTDKISNTQIGVGDNWKVTYLSPTVRLLLSLVVLEILIWVYVALHNAFSGKK